jgi:hypothetical protein
MVIVTDEVLKAHVYEISKQLSVFRENPRLPLRCPASSFTTFTVEIYRLHDVMLAWRCLSDEILPHMRLQREHRKCLCSLSVENARLIAAPRDWAKNATSRRRLLYSHGFEEAVMRKSILPSFLVAGLLSFSPLALGQNGMGQSGSSHQMGMMSMQDMMKHMQAMMGQMQGMMQSQKQMEGHSMMGGHETTMGMLQHLHGMAEQMRDMMQEMQTLGSEQGMMANPQNKKNLEAMQGHMQSMMESMDAMLENMKQFQKGS